MTVARRLFSQAHFGPTFLCSSDVSVLVLAVVLSCDQHTHATHARYIMCARTHTHASCHVRTHARVMHARTHARTHAHTHQHIHAQARTHARTHQSTHARTHQRMHASMHHRTHARTHARTHTRMQEDLGCFSDLQVFRFCCISRPSQTEPDQAELPPGPCLPENLKILICNQQDQWPQGCRL